MSGDYNRMPRLDGKVALVTGGSRGLGAEIAEAPLQVGASVMITDVGDDVGRRTQGELANRHPGRVEFADHDVTQEGEWEAAIAATPKRFGGLDVLVNNAGIVKTEMGVNVVRNFPKLGMAPDEAAADALVLSMHPIGYGQPSDVANAVVFLAGEASRWMTGAELVTDGGATAT